MKANPEIMKEIERLFNEYEEEVNGAKDRGLLLDNTVTTYLLHSRNFVRWCRGSFVPGDRNARKRKS